MRAQNEPLETVVRLVRGEPAGGRADRRPRRATASNASTSSALAEGRIWPQSRGSQLAGLVVGSRDGERVLDLCAAPGGKTTQLARRGDGGRARTRGRARELRANLAQPRRRRTSPSSRPTARAAAGARRLRPRARRRAVLRPRRPRAAARPALARASRCRSSSSRCCASRPPSACGPAGRSSTRSARSNADENEAVVDASGLRVAAARRRVAAVRAPAPPGVPAHAAARPRHDRLLHRAAATARPTRGVDRERWAGRTGSGRSRSSRRSTRPTSRTSASRSRSCCAPGARVFHFDVGDGHFVEPITMGPIVLESIAPLVHAARRRDRLPPDGRQPDAPLPADRARRAATASRSTTRPSTTLPATIAARARARAAGRDRVQSRDGARGRRARSRADVDLVLCMSIHPGYSGQEFMPEALERIERLRAALPESTCTSRSTAASTTTTSARSTTRARR